MVKNWFANNRRPSPNSTPKTLSDFGAVAPGGARGSRPVASVKQTVSTRARTRYGSLHHVFKLLRRKPTQVSNKTVRCKPPRKALPAHSPASPPNPSHKPPITDIEPFQVPESKSKSCKDGLQRLRLVERHRVQWPPTSKMPATAMKQLWWWTTARGNDRAAQRQGDDHGEHGPLQPDGLQISQPRPVLFARTVMSKKRRKRATQCRSPAATEKLPRMNCARVTGLASRGKMVRLSRSAESAAPS